MTFFWIPTHLFAQESEMLSTKKIVDVPAPDLPHEYLNKALKSWECSKKLLIPRTGWKGNIDRIWAPIVWDKHTDNIYGFLHGFLFPSTNPRYIWDPKMVMTRHDHNEGTSCDVCFMWGPKISQNDSAGEQGEQFTKVNSMVVDLSWFIGVHQHYLRIPPCRMTVMTVPVSPQFLRALSDEGRDRCEVSHHVDSCSKTTTKTLG